MKNTGRCIAVFLNSNPIEFDGFKDDKPRVIHERSLLYDPIVWCSDTKYRRTIYCCNRKYGKGKHPCATPHYTEDEIKSACVTVFNRILAEKESIITTCRETVLTVMNTHALDIERAVIAQKLEKLSKTIRQLIYQNASTAQDQGSYDADYEALASQYVEVNERLETVDRMLRDGKNRRIELEAYLGVLEARTNCSLCSTS